MLTVCCDVTVSCTVASGQCLTLAGVVAGACDESREGPFYTHLGAGYDVQSVRTMIEQR